MKEGIIQLFRNARKLNQSLKLCYKYREFSDNTDKIILNSELYFASHNSFNDPFDCNLEFREISSYSDEEFEEHRKEINIEDKNKHKYLEELRKKLISKKAKVGILCMSQDYKNILMWSHYTKNHEGLCFGFDFRLFEDKKLIVLKLDIKKIMNMN